MTNAKNGLIFVLSVTVVILAVWLYRIHPSVNPKVEVLSTAAADIEGSLGVGMTFAQFGEKLQRLASATVVAKNNGVDIALLQPYVDALAIYKDSYDLWSSHVQHPRFDSFGGHSYVVGDLAKKYAVPISSTFSYYDQEQSYNLLLQALWRKAGDRLPNAKR